LSVNLLASSATGHITGLLLLVSGGAGGFSPRVRRPAQLVVRRCRRGHDRICGRAAMLRASEASSLAPAS
jgi:hypothetical protein